MDFIRFLYFETYNKKYKWFLNSLANGHNNKFKWIKAEYNFFLSHFFLPLKLQREIFEWTSMKNEIHAYFVSFK